MTKFDWVLISPVCLAVMVMLFNLIIRPSLPKKVVHFTDGGWCLDTDWRKVFHLKRRTK